MGAKEIIVGTMVATFIIGFGYCAFEQANAQTTKIDDSGIFRSLPLETQTKIQKINMATLTPQETQKIKEEVAKLLEFQNDNKGYRKLNQNLGGVLKNNAEYSILKYAEEYNVNQFLVAAIIKHESANGTSRAIKTQNNVAGFMGKDGKLKTFDTLADSIKAMCHSLRNYYLDENRDTIEKIQKKYAPIGTANDPDNLNKFWLPCVTKYFSEISEDI